MVLCLGTPCKLSLWSERLEKVRAPSQAPKTALKLFVFVPSLSPGSPLDRRSVVVFLLTMNNPGSR